MNLPAAERAHAELQRLLAERQGSNYWIAQLERLLAEHRPEQLPPACALRLRRR